MKNLTFEQQIEATTAPCSLVFYTTKYVKMYKSLEDCRQQILQGLHAVNDYDPMQFHGIKTTEELEAQAEIQSRKEYNDDQKYKFSIDRVAVEKNKVIELAEIKKRIELLEGFVQWGVPIE